MAPVTDLAARPERELIDAIGAGVLAANEDGTITEANAAACRILGAARGAVVGTDIESHLGPLSDLIARRRGEIRSAHDQTLFGYAVTPVDHGPRPSWVVLFQEASAVLELRAEWDRLLQLAAIGDALPSMLHELKNPLAALSTMLEVMLEGGESVRVEDLHPLLTEVRRIHLTLQGVGAFSAALRSRRFHAIDLAVEEACRVLEPTAARKGIVLLRTVPLLPLLPLDRNVMSGIVFNLVRNAIDACAAGNTIRVEVALDTAGAGRFLLAVQDDGVGMSADVVARCTELFYTSKPSGSGVGLALCKQVATQAGGALEIESREGEGTLVRVTVPLDERTQEAH